MQAITTKYLAPTNFRGARIKATASAGSITIGYRYAFDIEENHREAAHTLADKYGWLTNGTTLHGGQLPNGDWTWVLIPAPKPIEVTVRGGVAYCDEPRVTIIDFDHLENR